MNNNEQIGELTQELFNAIEFGNERARTACDKVEDFMCQQAEQIGKLREKLDEISNTYPIRCTGLKNGSLCACQIIQEIVNEAAPPQKDEWTKSQRL